MRGDARWVGALGLAAGLGVAGGCGGERACDSERLPGLCQAFWSSVAWVGGVDDAARGDLDGDGLDEWVSIDRGVARLTIAWGDGRRSTVPLGGRVHGIELGDLDGDGRTEILAAVEGGAGLRRLVLDGAGGLQELDPVDLDGSPRDLWVGDLDGDGVDEALLVDALGGRLLAVHGGDLEVVDLPAGVGPVDLDVGDLDGDGAMDVAVADLRGSSILLLWGHAGGAFSPAQEVASVPAAAAVDFGDLDGDGDLDLIARGAVAEVRIFLGDGAGGLVDGGAVKTLEGAEIGEGLAVVPVEGVWPGGVALVEDEAISIWPFGQDLGGRSLLPLREGSALIDLGASGLYSGGYGSISPIERRQGASLVEVWRSPAADVEVDGAFGARRAIAEADLDGDGRVDLVTLWPFTASTGAARLDGYLGRGDGTYAAAWTDEVDGARSFALADLDGDGRVEVILAGPSSASIASLGPTGPEAWVDAPALADEAVTLRGSLRGAPSRLLRGDGIDLRVTEIDAHGALVDEVVIDGGGGIPFAIVDLEGDGDEDLVVGFGFGGASIVQAYLADASTLLPGPRHDLVELVDLEDFESLLGVTATEVDGVVQAAALTSERLVRIRGVEGAIPVLETEVVRSGWEQIDALGLGDVDGDGEQDVVVEAGAILYAPSSIVSLPELLLDGVGPCGLCEVDTSASVIFRDLDGDGRIDALRGDPRRVSALLSADGPRLVAGERVGWDEVSGGSPRALDVDGDGRLELVMVGDEGVAVAWSPGTRDERTEAAPVDDLTRGTEAGGDLDGDGRDEVILADRVIRWQEGRLVVTPLIFEGDPLVGQTILGDFDGDRRADLARLAGHAPIELGVHFGRGDDRLSAPLRIDAPIAGGLHAVDLDRDGSDELVVLAGHGRKVQVFFRGAGGAFTSTVLDADDAIVRPRSRDLLILRGDRIERIAGRRGALGGPDRFAVDPQLEGATFVGVGDLDGDGREDLLVEDREGASSVWLGRRGRLKDGIRLPVSFQRPSLIADLDGGGLDDLVAFGSILFGEGG
ncbi:MAG: VCBS repeat-containing protein [Nannocystaceae bacterium]